MAKGQQRTSKETRKIKDPLKKAKKSQGPKYLREADTLQSTAMGSRRPK